MTFPDENSTPSLISLNSEIIECRRCPRLVEWRERVAREKRASFADWEYWGRPVPGLGDQNATHLIVGLAPAAHGANRTGRMFTGDRSGDWLFRALHKAGVANQATAVSADDGLELTGAWITASCHCAPPDNKPTNEEMENCSRFLRTVLADRQWRAILCLGSIGFGNVCKAFGAKGLKFGHGLVYPLESGPTIVCSYHPSQQNTFTGRLTEEMLDQAIQAWLNA